MTEPWRTAVRSERRNDAAAIGRVHDQAFGQPQEGRLVNALRRSADFLPDLSLVAVDQNEVVGHVMLSRIQIVGEEPGPAIALAPMAVVPSLQGRGIGSILVRTGLHLCRRRGESLVIVLGHPEYYPRFGFVSAHNLGVLPPHDWPREAWMALVLQPGHPRGTVQYPDAFTTVT